MNTNKKDSIKKYIKEFNKKYNEAISGEHTYRSTIEILFKDFEDIVLYNEPGKMDNIIKSKRKPDYLCNYNNLPFGFIECKRAELAIEPEELAKDPHNKAQFEDLFNNIDNLIYTNHKQFILYRNRQKVYDVTLLDNDLKLIKGKEKELESLINYFINFAPIPIASADGLAERLAENAKIITEKITEELEERGEDSPLYSIYDTFKDKLISNIDYKDFAQMMAQTICYGLFAAFYNFAKPHKYDENRSKEFNRTNAYEFLPNTNKSLKEIFKNISGDDFFEGIKWVADDVVRILNITDMNRVLNKFGECENNDPIIHFYETFLNKYDPKYKKRLGVFYTPRPVVDYIIKSLDYVLREEFGEPLGLASDTKAENEFLVQILDPATGTGAFLTDIISNIHKTVTEKLGEGQWQNYVKDNLLERLNAFEIMMAPYTIAHINVAQQLSELGYDLNNDKPLNIVLADTLQKPENTDKLNLPLMTGLTDNIKTANNIKQKKKIMVICGNPPYSGSSNNADNKYICDMVSEEYYPNDKIKEKNLRFLQDDYVKFIRFAQDKLSQTDKGILGFITNNGYLTNLTFRRMRQSLMKTFNKIYIVNLHGNSLKKETAPDGSKDENVFDIRVGTSIIIGVKNKGAEKFIKYKDLYGLRIEKFDYLRNNNISTTDFENVEPQKSDYFFTPRDTELENKYNKFYSVKDIMPKHNTGIITKRDKICIDFDEEKLWNRIKDFNNLTCEKLKEKYNIKKDSRDWVLEKAKQNVIDTFSDKNIKEIYYRPFDTRYIYYTNKSKGFMAYPTYDIMQHMLKNNLCFSLCRQGSNINNNLRHIILISNTLIDMNTLTSMKGTYCFPFYLYNESEGLDIKYEEKVPNLDDAFCRNIAEKTGLKYVPECDENKLKDLGKNEFAPRHVFNYIYGLLSGRAYRKKYMQFIDTDFPRIPLPKNRDLFLKIGDFGRQLINLHLMKEKPDYAHPFQGTGNNLVEKPRFEKMPEKDNSPKNAPYLSGGWQNSERILTGGDTETISEFSHPPSDADASATPLINMGDFAGSSQGLTGGDTETVSELSHPKSNMGDFDNMGRIYINKDQYFDNVSQQAWEYNMGGYQVLDKYLKDRKDREGSRLAYEEITHYQNIISVTEKTLKLTDEYEEYIKEQVN